MKRVDWRENVRCRGCEFVLSLLGTVVRVNAAGRGQWRG